MIQTIARSSKTAASLIVLSGSLAACSSDASRFGQPNYTASTKNQREVFQPQTVYRSPSYDDVVTLDEPGQTAQQNLRPVASNTVAYKSPKPDQQPTQNYGNAVFVQPGDTLYGIASRYRVPLRDLMSRNQIYDPNQIEAGDRIFLPQVSPAPTPVARNQMPLSAPLTTASVHKVVPQPYAAAPQQTQAAAPTTPAQPKAVQPVTIYQAQPAQPVRPVTIYQQQPQQPVQPVQIYLQQPPAQPVQPVRIIQQQPPAQPLQQVRVIQQPAASHASNAQLPRRVVEAPQTTASTAQPAAQTQSLSVKKPSRQQLVANSVTPTPEMMYVLKDGDTLYSLSRRFGTNVSSLMSRNGITDPSRISAGQSVIVPMYAANSLPQRPEPNSQPLHQENAARYHNFSSVNYTQSITPPARPAAQVESRAVPYSATNISPAPSITGSVRRDSVHVVQPGDTIYSLGRHYNISPSDIISRNNLTNGNVIHAGQRLIINRAPTSAPATAYAPAATAVETVTQRPKAVTYYHLPQPAPLVRPKPAVANVPNQTAQAPKVVVQAPTKPVQTVSQQTTASTPATTLFRWPAKGKIISKFGLKANGERNDGINLEVPAGAMVRAAEGGKVIYAGNELKGYGNLVLVRHNNGWVSAYAHNSNLMVKRGDIVDRGQAIARAGSTGNVSRPQVHFELRKGSKPVDPLPYLQGA